MACVDRPEREARLYDERVMHTHIRIYELLVTHVHEDALLQGAIRKRFCEGRLPEGRSALVQVEPGAPRP